MGVRSFVFPGCCLASGMRALFASCGFCGVFTAGVCDAAFRQRLLRAGVLLSLGLFMVLPRVFCRLFFVRCLLVCFGFLGGCAVCFWGLVPALFSRWCFCVFLREGRALPVRVRVSVRGGGDVRYLTME